jgi:hypothetical protein
MLLEHKAGSSLRRAMAAGMLLAAIGPARVAHAQSIDSATAPNLAGLHDFDFLVGEWRVHHRTLRGGNGQWQEFDGWVSNRPLMDGWTNVEDHRFDKATGVGRAVGLRTYDPRTALWAIWWIDGRDPHRPMDPPVKGRFENGVGTFYADEVHDGKPIRVRFIWSRITARSARWEQAFSSDAGKTWETNWIMEFERAVAQRATHGRK